MAEQSGSKPVIDEEDTEDMECADDMEENSSDDEQEMGEEDAENGDGDSNVKQASRVYLPDQPVKEGEELVCDESAYYMYHQAQTGAPCLSFDILPDKLGDNRESFPLSCYMVAGTQAERSHLNNVIVIKMNNLHGTKKGKKKDEKTEDEADDSDSDSSSDEEDGEDSKLPKLETAMIKHVGGVNRIRATEIGEKHVAASWSETGKVHILDLTPALNAVNDSQAMAAYNKQPATSSLFTFTGHQAEGFAVDWSPMVPGRLATGDCRQNLHVWNVMEDGKWNVDQRPFVGHTASVEDIQWSPNEASVFCSCSVDKSIRIWDVRAAPNKACMLAAKEAHDRDVNVVSWNSHEPFIISGGDDGMIKIWDLRQFQTGKPVASFKHHTAPITSVEWYPYQSDSSVFAASGSDDQTSLWDLAVEKDTESSGTSEAEPEIPPQLLFIHQGQKDIKELHWHPQLPGVLITTAHSGFNVFRTVSV